jgi:hypothetical protein
MVYGSVTTKILFFFKINLDRSTKNNSYVLSNENFMQVLISFRAVAPTPVKVNCRLKCFVTLVTYCYNNVFVYFNL